MGFGALTLLDSFPVSMSGWGGTPIAPADAVSTSYTAWSASLAGNAMPLDNIRKASRQRSHSVDCDGVQTALAGSGCSFRAYVFRRVPGPERCTDVPAALQSVTAAGKQEAAEPAIATSRDCLQAPPSSTAKAAAAAVRDGARTVRRAARAGTTDASQVGCSFGVGDCHKHPSSGTSWHRKTAVSAGLVSDREHAVWPQVEVASVPVKAVSRSRPRRKAKQAPVPHDAVAAEEPQPSGQAAQLSADGVGVCVTVGEEVQSAASKSPTKPPQPGSGVGGSPGRGGVQKAASPKKPKQATLWGRVRTRVGTSQVKGAARNLRLEVERQEAPSVQADA